MNKNHLLFLTEGGWLFINGDQAQLYSFEGNTCVLQTSELKSDGEIIFLEEDKRLKSKTNFQYSDDQIEIDFENIDGRFFPIGGKVIDENKINLQNVYTGKGNDKKIVTDSYVIKVKSKDIFD